MKQKIPPLFLTELARYYSHYLDSDAEQSHVPKRNVKEHEIQEAFFHLQLNRYREFTDMVMDAMKDNMRLSLPLTVEKEAYIRLLDFEEVDAITGASLQEAESVISRILAQKPVIDAASLQETILSKKRLLGEHFKHWLSNFEICNLFDELMHVTNNKEMVGKKEFQLYFMSISFQNVRFPLFYFPLEVEKASDQSFSFNIQPMLHINKKAIDYLIDQMDVLWIPTAIPRHVHTDHFRNRGEMLRYMQIFVNEMCKHFNLPSISVIAEENVQSYNGMFTIRNDLFLSLFDPSDESVVQDYEKLSDHLQTKGSSDLSTAYHELVRSYFYDQPLQVAHKVEEALKMETFGKRFYHPNPLPLNEEQYKLMTALDLPHVRYAAAEGAPGTGKSHTIAAAIFDHILQNKKVLFVSNNQASLGDVERILLRTFQEKGLDVPLPNLFLRLDQKENSFFTLFDKNHVTQIKRRHRQMASSQPAASPRIQQLQQKIHADIQQTFTQSEQVTFKKIEDLLKFDYEYEENWKHLVEPSEATPDFIVHFQKLWDSLHALKAILGFLAKKADIALLYPGKEDTFLDVAALIKEELGFLQNILSSKQDELVFQKEITKEKIASLDIMIREMEKFRLPLVGYWFTGDEVKQIEHRIKDKFKDIQLDKLSENKSALKEEVQFYRFCEKTNEKLKEFSVDTFKLLREELLEKTILYLEKAAIAYERASDTIASLPATANNLQIFFQDIRSYLSTPLLSLSKEEVDRFLSFYQKKQQFFDQTHLLFHSNLAADRSELESLLLQQIIYELDAKTVQLSEHEWNDAVLLRNHLHYRTAIPKHLLGKLLDHFPVVFATAKDISDTIPLEADLFDLVIVDEASELGVAESFPVLLRGKRLLTMGDLHPFQKKKMPTENSKQLNQLLFNRVKAAFGDQFWEIEEKIKYFNGQQSLLQFIAPLTNYRVSFKQHFHSYYELTDYANELFYDRSLQVMKARLKPLSEVIRFHEVPAPNASPVHSYGNASEAQFVLSELIRLKHEGFQGTVGIITPFAEQQKQLITAILADPNYPYYQRYFQLKVMTFDSCQGETRDLIFYSMVEGPQENTLEAVFPRNLHDPQELKKAHRLSIGLNRAKEAVCFVISKPIDQFTGEIARAMDNFAFFLKDEGYHEMKNVHESNPAETAMMKLIEQTDFYQQNRMRIRTMSSYQFRMFLKQTYPAADLAAHNAYVMLIYTDRAGSDKFLIFEYNDFEKKLAQSHNKRFASHYSLFASKEIELHKTLEFAGFPTIRLNRFTLEDPYIRTINDKIEQHFVRRQQLLVSEPAGGHPSSSAPALEGEASLLLPEPHLLLD